MKPVLQTCKVFVSLLTIFMLMGFKCGNKNLNGAAQSAPAAPLLSEKQYNALFPQRDEFYTYAAFIQAVKELSNINIKITKRAYEALQMTRTDKATGKSTIIREDKGFNEDWARTKPDSVYYINFGKFCAEKDAATNKKELAAFFAHIAHETRLGQNNTYTDGLMLKHEGDTSNNYIAQNEEYPAAKGKKYYGRGPMQLSWNGNYGYASHCIFGNKEKLLNNPELIEQDAVIAFKTAIYFWMTPQAPKPSAHDAITGIWQPAAAEKAKGRVPGFASTINIINGALECGKGESQVNMQDRIAFYRHFLKQLDAKDDGCECSCGKMAAYTF